MGVINPRNLRKTGRYAVEVTNPPKRVVDTASPWAGMSGAAVFAEGLLIGVVEGDPAGFASHRLTATPTTAFLDDPCVQQLIVDHTGIPPRVEPVELVVLAEPVQPVDSPVGLLRADVAPMRFRSRESEMDALLAWAHTAEAWSARLVAGPGGQGKSRLAREFAEKPSSMRR